MRPSHPSADAPPPRPALPDQEKRRKGRPFDRGDFERTALLCPPCHRNVHYVLDHKDLEREYRTIAAPREHPGIRRFTAWTQDKPHGTGTRGS